jgi:hypothetical protein
MAQPHGVVLEQIVGHILNGGCLRLEKEPEPSVALSLEVSDGGELVDRSRRGRIAPSVPSVRAPVTSWRGAVPLPEHRLLAHAPCTMDKAGVRATVCDEF